MEKSEAFSRVKRIKHSEETWTEVRLFSATLPPTSMLPMLEVEEQYSGLEGIRRRLVRLFPWEVGVLMEMLMDYYRENREAVEIYRRMLSTEVQGS